MGSIHTHHSVKTDRVRQWRRIARLGIIVFTVACGRGSPAVTGPSTTPQAPTAKSVGFGASGGLPGQLQVGQQIQLRAVAVLSDNSTRDVTGEATFSATKPEIATLSPQGLLTGIAPGAAGIHVDYQSLSNQWSIIVAGPDIAAYVHEASPRNICLAGAQVRVDGEAYRGVVLTADNNGRVPIPNLQTAPFTLTISRPGYATASFTVPQYPRDTSADVALTPTTRIVDRVWDGTFAPDQCDVGNLRDGQRSLFFTPAADGIVALMTVRMNVLDIGGFGVWRGSDALPYICPAQGKFALGAYYVTQGVQYELRLLGYGCGLPRFPPFYDGTFHVEFSRPE